ncbi:hypothetical protein CC1G_03143 [Coprinopsis cinerea okayama7|uniref:Uncharacterized protein n=1 Tax=Coprinopsis cinerea (strain Okayama-7 / 130 / ATCC MYA-4618 / FGSC 9003) TaxID=240176 RepID=A8PF34_COPC7|nr:hypothetical protein CC1G_03143 [Coprinopsis cinerea okayama7\|eukprot:XP_001840914.1 hypothetical protein CC1G_03143 [Coprinopsis cinerea okayama7\
MERIKDLTEGIENSDIQALVKAINDDPSISILLHLASALGEASVRNPSKIDQYLVLISKLCDSPDVSEISYEEEDESTVSEPFGEICPREICDGIQDRHYSDIQEHGMGARSKAISLDNVFLSTSLLSGCWLRDGMCYSNILFGHIIIGLQFPEAKHEGYFDPEFYEVHAIASCINLLASARRLLDMRVVTEPELRQGIERVAPFVLDPTGKRVLEASRRLASEGFQTAYSSQAICSLLD